MKIAIIDTGVDKSHRRLKNALISGISIFHRDNKWHFSEDFSDHLGHGTACAGIIHSHIPDAELIAIKIFHKGEQTKEDYLIEALRWIAQDEKIKLVNISLGAGGAPNPVISELCDSLMRRGTILVAAANNDICKKDYPAALPSVIGVLAGQVKKNIFGITPDGYIVGKGSLQRVASLEGKDIITTGTSYATPHIVGIIARMLRNNPQMDTSNVLKKLEDESTPNVKPIQYMSRLSFYKKPTYQSAGDELKGISLFTEQKFKWVGRIAVFPISEKEMKQFIDFDHMVKYPVSLKIDYPRTFSSFNVNNDKKFLRDIPSDAQFDQFDTLVIGYFYDSLWEGNIVFGNRLINKALEKRKNFFVYDKRVAEYIEERLKENNLGYKPEIYLPKIERDDYLEYSSFEFLPNVDCPVMMVIGTSNKQGKFTTQLRIKEAMEKEGYKVGFMSTEPQGELFGANFVFPSGHMRMIDLKSIELVPFLRNVFKGICHYNAPHIIITGSQGAFMPYNPVTAIPMMGTLESIGTLYGALPDIIACSINPNDDIEVINKITLVAKLYSNCQIAFYAITPWENIAGGGKRKLGSQELGNRIEYYERHLDAPVINVMESKSIKIIVERIEKLCS
ncbi:MAG: S8 family serine peptidase [Odoribacter sp.]|nr:S8 family serine peptidase [Odoribacter sp.]